MDPIFGDEPIEPLNVRRRSSILELHARDDSFEFGHLYDTLPLFESEGVSNPEAFIQDDSIEPLPFIEPQDELEFPPQQQQQDPSHEPPEFARELLSLVQHLLTDENLCHFLLEREPVVEVTHQSILSATEVHADFIPLNQSTENINISSTVRHPISALIIPHSDYKNQSLYVTYRVSQGGLLLHRYLVSEDISGCFARGAIIKHDDGWLVMVEFLWTPSQQLLVSIMKLKGGEKHYYLSIVLAYLPEDGSLPTELLKWGTQIVETTPNVLAQSSVGNSVPSKASIGIGNLFRTPAVLTLRVVDAANKTQKGQILQVVRTTSMERNQSLLTDLKKSAMQSLLLANAEDGTEVTDLAEQTMEDINNNLFSSLSVSSPSSRPGIEPGLFQLLAVELLGASHATNAWMKGIANGDDNVESGARVGVLLTAETTGDDAKSSGVASKDSGDKSSSRESESRMYECELCGFRFRKKNDLRRHIDARHLTKRDFACTLCTARFGRESNLRRHSRALHGSDKPYVCRRCNAAFSVKASYDPHVQKCFGAK